jgi:hypothetical protein
MAVSGRSTSRNIFTKKSKEKRCIFINYFFDGGVVEAERRICLAACDVFWSLFVVARLQESKLCGEFDLLLAGLAAE